MRAGKSHLINGLLHHAPGHDRIRLDKACRRASQSSNVHTKLREGELKLEHKSSLGFRQIADEWSREPGTLPYSEVLTELLRAYWKGEFAGEDAPDREDTLKVLNYIDAIPYQYWDDEKPPGDDYEFLAGLPPDGYDETAAECYGEVAWAVLDGVKIPKQVLAAWCDAKGISGPTSWFGKPAKSPGTMKARTDCARWFREEVKKEKWGARTIIGCAPGRDILTSVVAASNACGMSMHQRAGRNLVHRVGSEQIIISVSCS